MKQSLLKIMLIVAGFTLATGLSRFLETSRTALPPEIVEADLAFKSETLKKYSGGFDGLIADYYWISALQYIGRKIIDNGGMQNIRIDDLQPLNPRLLYPLLNTVTTLDPEFSAVYSYGAIVLPAVNVEQAIIFTEKGIAAQPDNWQLYHLLGYIYWKNKDFQKASEAYAAGATKLNAPAWMRQMSAILQAEGSSRNAARAIYRQLYENARDEQTRELAARRMLQVESFDELDAIRAALTEFQTQNNRCPNDWRELFPLVRNKRLPNGKGLRFNQVSEPVDPSGAVYYLDNRPGKCETRVNVETSKVPPENQNKE